MQAAVLSGVLVLTPIILIFAAAFVLRIPHSEIETRRDGKHYFRGHLCTQDCSGHIAGYQWAKKHDIDDYRRCHGNSESFRDGCMIYTEEQYSRSSTTSSTMATREAEAPLPASIAS